MNLESVANNFDVLISTKNGIRQVKELILDIALKGKLLDNPDKSISLTEDSQYPLPSSWRWAKIEEVADFINGFAFRSEEYCSKGVGVVRMSDMKNGEINPSGMKFVSTDRLKELDSIFQVKPNDIIMGMTGATLGKPCVNKTSETFLLNQRIGKFVPKDIDPDYLLIALMNLESSFMRLSFGTGVNNLSTRQIKDSLLPLPPRDIQRKIVAFVRGVYDLCDKLDTSLNSKKNLANLARKSAISAILMAHSGNELEIAWRRIQDNWEVIVGDLEAIDSVRQLILSLAAKGKLVENPDRFSNATTYFELNEVCQVSWGNLALTKSSYTEDGEFLAVSAAGPDGRIGIAEHKAYTPVLSAIGARCGTLFMPSEDFTAIKNTMTLQPKSNLLDNWYLFYTLRGSELHRRGSAQPFMSKSDIEKFKIRVPSLDEQKLIASTVESLLETCDLLESKLREADQLTEKFARSVIAASA